MKKGAGDYLERSEFGSVYEYPHILRNDFEEDIHVPLSNCKTFI